MLENIDIPEKRCPYIFFNKIYTSLIKKFSDKELCYDATHLACIKAIEKIHLYNHSKSAYSTWLYRIAYNNCIDQLRKKERHRLYLQKKYAQNIFLENENATQALELEEKRKRINIFLECLDAEERNILMLKYINCLKNKEIIEILNISLTRYFKIMRCAKQKIREKYKTII